MRVVYFQAKHQLTELRTLHKEETRKTKVRLRGRDPRETEGRKTRKAGFLLIPVNVYTTLPGVECHFRWSLALRLYWFKRTKRVVRMETVSLSSVRRRMARRSKRRKRRRKRKLKDLTCRHGSSCLSVVRLFLCAGCHGPCGACLLYTQICFVFPTSLLLPPKQTQREFYTSPIYRRTCAESVSQTPRSHGL